MAAKYLLSEECSVAINHSASYELHISDIYSSTPGFERHLGPSGSHRANLGPQPEQRRPLWDNHRDNKRPETDNWQMGIKALESALESENQ
ncbi:hypothetical protein D623_10024174 [Myotis brandtii]|uniref:Uncharacterized protein n=1 Tax=Myotis brandtii TaxID=109478 RepID=S7Q523_MYOBR|nr:hypothetical protein D623_10024174 [Myotis brandtii]